MQGKAAHAYYVYSAQREDESGGMELAQIGYPPGIIAGRLSEYRQLPVESA